MLITYREIILKMGQRVARTLNILKGYLCIKDGMNYFFTSSDKQETSLWHFGQKVSDLLC